MPKCTQRGGEGLSINPLNSGKPPTFCIDFQCYLHIPIIKNHQIFISNYHYYYLFILLYNVHVSISILKYNQTYSPLHSVRPSNNRKNGGLGRYTARFIKQEDDFQSEVMILYSPMKMKHCSCAILSKQLIFKYSSL